MEQRVSFSNRFATKGNSNGFTEEDIFKRTIVKR